MSYPRVLILASLIAVLAGGGLLSPRSLTAQEAGDGRTTDIYAGECGDELADPVATLVQPNLSEGEAEGASDARPVATSFTAVPLALDALLADAHVIAVVEDQETAACGAIGGVRTNAGAIVIELSEQGNAGLSGVAYLAPSGTGSGQTDISLFLAGLEPAQPEPTAEPTAEPTVEATTEAGQDASGEVPTEAGAAADAVTVTITDAAFDPDPVTIPAGGTITWVNQGSLGQVVSVSGEAGTEFSSDVLLPGFGSASHTFTEPGTYTVVDAMNVRNRGTITVEPAGTGERAGEASGQASEEPTPAGGAQSGATETYVSPNFGYALSYDPTEWRVVEGPSEEGGIDHIGLQSGFTTVYLSGTVGVQDAQVCVQTLTDTQTTEPNVVSFEPLVDETGVPLAGGDISDYFATTRITRSTDDGGTVDQAFYARCIVLPASGAIVGIQQFAADIIYDTASQQREELLQGLTLP